MPFDPVAAVLLAYPKIYHACHREHPRARTNPNRISARDSWILGHLDLSHPTSPTLLARHLSLGASTVSEAVQRLERLGYLTRKKHAGDQRRTELYLSARGAEAMKGTSVLDAGRVERLLAQLTGPERAKAVAGLSLLAKAARMLNDKEPQRWHGDPE